MEPAVDMYPSLVELLEVWDHPLPESLIASLNQRYNEHGAEYTSDLIHTDGRLINQCMLKDSVEDAREELNDTIFNLLVACLKERSGVLERGIHSWKPRAALVVLVVAWQTLEGLSGQGSQ